MLGCSRYATNCAEKKKLLIDLLRKAGAKNLTVVGRRALVSLVLLQSLGLLATAQAAESQVDSPVRDKWALVIGVSKFQDAKLNLQYPAKDARDFGQFLTTHENFAGDHVKVLVDEQATRANILDLLADKWLPRIALPDDLVVIFISSHGSPSHADVAGANYLLAHDTDANRLFVTGISMQELASIIKERVHCRRVVIILDACHSGAALEQPQSKGINRGANFNANSLMQGTGQLVICSSDAQQSSWESKKYENSVFTRQLIDALSAQGPKTKLGPAFETLKEKVQTEVLAERGELQTPELKTKWQGSDLVLGCLPASPRAVPDIKDGITLTPQEPAQKASVDKPVPPPYMERLSAIAYKKLKQSQFDDATELYEILRAALESIVGRDTKYTTECLTELGWLYTVKGRLDDAASLQRESIRIETTLYGPTSFFVARETTLLCNTLLAKQDYVEAEPVGLKAIAIWEALGGKDTPYVLESLVNMAEIKQHFGNYEEAMALLNRAQGNARAQNLASDNAHRLKLENRLASLQAEMKQKRR